MNSDLGSCTRFRKAYGPVWKTQHGHSGLVTALCQSGPLTPLHCEPCSRRCRSWHPSFLGMNNPVSLSQDLTVSSGSEVRSPVCSIGTRKECQGLQPPWGRDSLSLDWGPASVTRVRFPLPVVRDAVCLRAFSLTDLNDI